MREYFLIVGIALCFQIAALAQVAVARSEGHGPRLFAALVSALFFMIGIYAIRNVGR